MGSNSSSGGSGNNNSANNVPPSKRKYDVSGTLSDPREKDDTAAKMSLFREQGATNIKNAKFQTPTTALLSIPLQAGSRYTRDYFTGEVLGKGAYKGTTKQDFERMTRSAQESIYKDYITGRTSGKTDAYGRTISASENGGAMGTSGQIVQAPAVTAPTTAEVSQAAPEVTAEQARAKANELITKKRKGIGRSMTILTSAQGIEDDKNLILGKKILLG